MKAPAPCPGRIGDLWRDHAGVTILEFAIIAPVFVLLIFGMTNIGQIVYGKVVLDGAVEIAARNSSLETGNTTTADTMVEQMVKNVLPGVTVSSTRKNYYDFNDIARAEKWNDTNKNGTCAGGESYVDENRNGRWDSDVGLAGNGGAYDVVIYTVTAKFKPLFQMPLMPYLNGDQTLVSRSVRKNQPFANQPKYGSSSGVCA